MAIVLYWWMLPALISIATILPAFFYRPSSTYDFFGPVLIVLAFAFSALAWIVALLSWLLF